MPTTIVEGRKAEESRLQDAQGTRVSLSDFEGKDVYFCPKDDTPGCTKEACGFTSRAAEGASAGGVRGAWALVVVILHDRDLSQPRVPGQVVESRLTRRDAAARD
jgi:hypothetical protein